MPSSTSSARDDRRSGLDRRRFLGLVGAGGVGVAGLSFALPALAWGETIDAITLGERLNKLAVASHGDSWTWAEKCQAARVQLLPQFRRIRRHETPVAKFSADIARVADFIENLCVTSRLPGKVEFQHAPGTRRIGDLDIGHFGGER